MNVERSVMKVYKKHVEGHDLLREEVEVLFGEISRLEWAVVDAAWVAYEVMEPIYRKQAEYIQELEADIDSRGVS